MSITLSDLADLLGATIVGIGAGSGDVEVTGCAPIDLASAHEITFLANKKYTRFLRSTRAAAVLIHPSIESPDQLTRLECDDPYFAFRNALIELRGFRIHPTPMDGAPDAPEGTIVSPRASVHPSATVGKGAHLHPGAVVEAGATIGRRTVLYPGAYVGTDTTVGDDCLLYPNVTVYDRCVVGNRVTLHSATVVGHDGFGYATHAGTHNKIPQTGIVEIGDDVELGAGCAIERAAMGVTRISRGTKFADLISIGHGTTIGEHCLLVSLVGISGSVEVGDYVVLGGQVGVTGHLKIGSGVQAAGKTAIAGDVPPGQKIGGIPAVEIEQAKRNALAGRNLYDLFRRVRELEREVRRLRDETSASST